MTSLIESLNLFGQRFMDFGLPMLVQSSLLIAFLLVLDLVLRKRVRAVVRYGLWMLVLIKLVLPPSLASPTGVGYWVWSKQPEKSVIAPAPVQVTVSYSQAEPIYIPTTPPPPLPRYTPTLSWPAILLLGWASVAIALVIWLVLRARFVARISAREDDAPESLLELLQSCRQQMGIKQSIRLKLSNGASSPAVCGLWRPTILIPVQLAGALSALPMRAVLLHELAHIKRGDLWVNYAQTLLQIAYWYNPLLWLANAVIRRVREQAVDEMVMVEMGQEADAYPATLLEVAKLTFTRSVLSLGLVGIMESKSALKQRIQTLLSRPIPEVARLGWKGLTIVSLVGLVALPMASHPKANAVEPGNKPAGPAIVVEAAFITANKMTAGPFAISPNARMTGILNLEQTQLAMETFRRTEGVKIVDSIIDNVRNGRKGHFTIFVTGENSKLQSGVACEVQPVLKEGMIDLRVKARIGESPDPAATSEPLSSMEIFSKTFEFESSVSLPVGSSIVLHRQEDGGALENNYWVVLTARLAGETAATKTLNESRYGPRWALCFSVDTNLFVQGLQRSGEQSTNTNLYESISDFLMQTGLYIEPPNINYYNRDHGLLIISGTMNDFTIVEKAIKDLGALLGSYTSASTNLIHTTKGRQAILSKMDRIRLDEVMYDGLDPTKPSSKATDEPPAPTQDKVPVLGDLPLIGRFFRPEASFTNHLGAFPGAAAAIDPFTGLPVTTTGSENHAPGARQDVLAQIPASRTNTIQAATLVQDGRVLYESGKLDEAEAKLNLALKDDPGNFGANYYLNLIRETRQRKTVLERNQPVIPNIPNPYARTNLIHTSKGRQAILPKLDRIRLDEVHYVGLQLSEVVKALNIETRKRDPDKAGVNFIINSHVQASPTTAGTSTFQDAAPKIDQFTGLPASATVNNRESVDMNAIAITINPAITEVRLADVLDAIVKVADKPIKYSIEDYGVVFSAKAAEAAPLFTRFYKMDPNSFYQGLEAAGALSFGGISTNSDSRNSGSRLKQVEFVQATVRAFFTACGADLNPPKNIFFNDRQGMLMVRGTLQDLEIVESAVQSLNIAPPQISIEARFVTVPREDFEKLGLGNPDQLSKTTNGTFSIWLLPSDKSRALIALLQQQTGVELLSTPKVTTLSARQAHIEVVDTNTPVQGIKPQALSAPGVQFTNRFKANPLLTLPLNSGCTLDVLPEVGQDGYTIHVKTSASVTEFLGYDDRPLVFSDNTLPQAAPVPLPSFRVQRMAAEADLRDGQTLIIGSPTITDVLIGSDGQLLINTLPKSISKDLIVLVTPTIIDPTGNRIHSDDEIPSEKRK